MFKKTFVAISMISILFLFAACDLLKGAEPPPAAPVPVAMPEPALPPAPPRTELIPVAAQPAVDTAAEEVAPAPTATGKPGVKKPGGDNVDAPITGPGTDGDELLGNYTCTITSNDFPMGISPPPSGCRVTRTGEGTLQVGPTGGVGFRGTISDPKATGFRIVGSYGLGPLGKFDLQARMLRKGGDEYSGSGNGVLNGNKEKQMKFNMTMTKN